VPQTIPVIPIIPIIPIEFRLCAIDSKESNTLLILAEMLPPVYTNAVLADYHKKREKNDLPVDMKQLSPASLKAACKEVCRTRYGTREDQALLRAFFDGAADQKACLQAIDDHDINTFKPLVNLLKGKTKKPDDKIVELAAWLIDFKDRPYDYRKDYSIDAERKHAEKEGRPTQPIVQAGTKKEKRRRIIFVITITIALGMTVYWPLSNKSHAPIVIGHQACMFWNEDHYEPISCQPNGETVVIALDSEKLVHFRKITRPDTITANSIRSVWYVHYRKTYEFYTDSGYHPIDPQLRLLPITDYIIRNHIHPEQ
jgi:hypothetical protein